VPSLGTTGAIVMADDPEENAPGYPEYTLSVDAALHSRRHLTGERLRTAP
jgi:hypothetical protein